MFTSEAPLTPPPADRPPVEVPIDAETGTNLLVRQRQLSHAQEVLSSYMDGLCAGLKRPPSTLRGVQTGPDGLPIALLFEPAADPSPNGTAPPDVALPAGKETA